MSEEPAFDFADGKDPAAFRTIGEVAQAFGLRQHVLRYWEEQFPMLKPLKRAGGRRYYRPEDVRLVSEINRLLYQEGFTIRGARQAIEARTRSPGLPPPPPEKPGEELQRTEPPHAPDSQDDLGERLRMLRDELARALHHG
jgi:DNA-binding transcriptional MerR regulator